MRAFTVEVFAAFVVAAADRDQGMVTAIRKARVANPAGKPKR